MVSHASLESQIAPHPTLILGGSRKASRGQLPLGKSPDRPTTNIFKLTSIMKDLYAMSFMSKDVKLSMERCAIKC